MNLNILPPKPFVGLRPFESNESLIFFGRDEQIVELMQKLHETRFVAVLGSSGCGKSSLIRAGLIPKLQAGFLIEERDRWMIARMKPDSTPLQNLSAAVVNATSPDQKPGNFKKLFEAMQRSGSQAILEKIAPVFENGDTNLLLLVDQFEELFRFGLTREDESELNDAEQAEYKKLKNDAADFVSIMLELAEQNELPIYVVMTMRSDFLGDCDAFYGLPEALNRSQYLVPKLSRGQRREVIEGPIKLYGADISSRLVDQLLNDASDTTDQLPVLQHTLMRMWDSWQLNKASSLTMEHYAAIGTIKHALSIHADEAMTDMDQDEKLLTKSIFQILTDTDASNRRIRRPAHFDEIEKVTQANQNKIKKIIDRFTSEGRSFLIVSGVESGNSPAIDISHESLIRQWARLKDWVDEEAEDKRRYLKLVEAAQDFEKGEIDFWRDPQLQAMLDWRDEKKPTAAWAKQYHSDYDSAFDFLNQSKINRDAEVAEKERLRRRELKRTRLFAAALGIAFIIALIFLLFALNRQSLFKEQTEIAKENEAKAEAARKDAEKQEQEAIRKRLEAEQAKDYANEQARIANQEKTNAQRQAFLAQQRLAKNNWSNAIHAKENDDWIRASYYFSNCANYERDRLMIQNCIFNIQPLNKNLFLGSILAHEGSITGITFSHDEQLILTWSSDGTARLWHSKDGSAAAQPMKHDSYVNGAQFSRDEQ